jgi:trichothecene 3-O-acetyltransferase
MASLCGQARPQLLRAQTEHIVTLSSLDQSLMRSYVRLCLCFPVQKADLGSIEEKLRNIFTCHVYNRPFLAGNVHLVQGAEQSGLLELRCTRGDLEDWQPIVKHLSKPEFPYRYQELTDAGMPSSAFIGNVLNPLPDAPDSHVASAFRVQANLIQGGLIVALYLHHSVADGTSIALLLVPITEVPLSSSHGVQSLPTVTAAESRMREGLSVTNGVSANPTLHPEWDSPYARAKQPASPPVAVSRVFSFCENQLDKFKNALIQALDAKIQDHSRFLSTQDCLAALIWTSVTKARARKADSPATMHSILAMPVNIRTKVDPPLPPSYFGNACSLKLIALPFSRLLCNLDDIPAICLVASAIRNEIAKVDDSYARSAIAYINSCEDVRETNLAALDLETDLIYTNLSALPMEESDLGLGLGVPQWVRKPSTKPQGPGCIVLPKRVEQGLWEVMVQLEHRDMEGLLGDEGFRQFVVRVTD